MPNLPIMHVDAFVTEPNVPFTGNPAAVCLLDTPRPDHWLRSIAAEMNLSETAYLLPQANGRYQLRWFTPTCEVDLCGHATLAAAHALWETQHAPNHQPVRFDTRSGELIARPDPSGAIILDFPATPPKACDLPTPLAESLGIQPSWQGKTKFDAFLVIDEPSVLRRLKPDFHTLTEVDFRALSSRLSAIHQALISFLDSLPHGLGSLKILPPDQLTARLVPTGPVGLANQH